MSYDRKIKYVSAFVNGERVQNAGFIKLETVGENVGMEIHINGLKQADTCICPVVLVEEEREVKLGELTLEQGKGCCKNLCLDCGTSGEGVADVFREIKIMLGRGIELRCVINEKHEKEEGNDEGKLMFKSEAELLKEAFEQEKRTLEEASQEGELQEEHMQNMLYPQSEQNETIQEEKEEKIAVKERGEEKRVVHVPAGNKWQQLWEIYPHITPFEDDREYLVVKPEDFVVLHKEYYNLVSNSFLLHGYYNYDHLIMTKEVKKQAEKYYIGVPGNFYEKEKQVAVLFGFESFEGKSEPAGIGDFGYYMVGVEL